MTTLSSKKGILLVVSGSSGTGKGTVNAKLMQRHPEFAFSVSATTRAPRPGETDGKEYHFISRESFEEQIRQGGVIEYTEYCGNYYGTLKSELEKLETGKHLLLEIEVEGAMNIKRLFPEAVTVFILPPDAKTLRQRLVDRHTNTDADIENRMHEAMKEFALAKNYDYVVVNHDGKADEAAEAIFSIVESEKHRASRVAEQIDAMFLPS